MHKLGDLHGVAEMTDQEVITGIVDALDSESALAAHKYSLLAQFSRRGLNLKVNHSTPAHWLATGSRVAGGNASRQFARAEWLTTRPTVLDALAAGDIHDLHVKEIYDGHLHITGADSTLTPEQLTDAVAELLSVACEKTAHDVKTRAHQLGHDLAEQARMRYEKARQERARREQERQDKEKAGTPQRDDASDDPDDANDNNDKSRLLDGPPPQLVSENPALNTLEMYLQANGRMFVRIDLDKSAAELLSAAVAEFSRPIPGPDGSRDERSPQRRNADALMTALQQRRGSGSGTAPARVNVTVHLRDLMRRDDSSAGTDKGEREWPFYLTWTGPISHSLARMVSCDADLHPIILDDNGIPMTRGGTVRLATDEQRAVVTIRDRCCVKCGKTARFCIVHHIKHWADGGPTDLTNLTLLCPDCHNDVHHRGWEIAIGGDGHPCVIPPDTVDPERKPLPSYHLRRRPAA